MCRYGGDYFDHFPLFIEGLAKGDLVHFDMHMGQFNSCHALNNGS